MATQPDGDWRGNGLYRREERDACGVGFVAQLGAPPSHRVVEQALECLACLTHRGAVDADGSSGDGAGVAIQLPSAFFAREAARLNPQFKTGGGHGRKIAVGVFFLPAAEAERARIMAVAEQAVRRHRLEFVGWRPVPLDETALGPQARETKPDIWHLLAALPEPEGGVRAAGAGEGAASETALTTQGEREFEQHLYLVRKEIERRLLDAEL